MQVFVLVIYLFILSSLIYTLLGARVVTYSRPRVPSKVWSRFRAFCKKKLQRPPVNIMEQLGKMEAGSVSFF
jgi:hypothetical protein